jgi:hypothetical protein
MMIRDINMQASLSSKDSSLLKEIIGPNFQQNKNDKKESFIDKKKTKNTSPLTQR